MKKEITAELSSQNGQARIPRMDAFRMGIAQYETRRMHTIEARSRTVSAITSALGIDESLTPGHDKNEVNVTLMMIMSNRLDLAKALWIDPEEFRKTHLKLFDLGLKRVDVQIDHLDATKRGTQLVKKWERALKKILKNE